MSTREVTIYQISFGERKFIGRTTNLRRSLRRLAAELSFDNFSCAELQCIFNRGEFYKTELEILEVSQNASVTPHRKAAGKNLMHTHRFSNPELRSQRLKESWVIGKANGRKNGFTGHTLTKEHIDKLVDGRKKWIEARRSAKVENTKTLEYNK